MAEKLFDFGFSNATPTRTEGYEEDGQIILTETMPGNVIDAILRENQAKADLYKGKMGRDDMGIIGATVPITLWHKWRTEWKAGPKKWGVRWHKFLKAKLQDPDYKRLRFVNL